MLPRMLHSVSNASSRKALLHLCQKRFITLKPMSVSPNTKQNETFEEKNLRLNRPLSPHLSIYQIQLQTVLSISHRISGVAVTGYFILLAASSSFNVADLINAINSLQLSPLTLYGIKTVLALPISYHVLNGVRHLFWDAGHGLTNKGVYTSGCFILAGTILFSLYLAKL